MKGGDEEKKEGEDEEEKKEGEDEQLDENQVKITVDQLTGEYADKLQVSLVQEPVENVKKTSEKNKHGTKSKNAKNGCKCVSCCMPKAPKLPKLPSFPNFDFVFPLLKISMVMPDILSQFNMLPKEFEVFFTDDMFDQIMQESICKKMYQVMIGDTEFMGYLEAYVKNYPRGLQFKEEYLVPSKTSASFLERNTEKGNKTYLDVIKKSMSNVKKMYQVNEESNKQNAPVPDPLEAFTSGPLEAVTSGMESIKHTLENNMGIPDKIVDNVQELITNLETEAKQILKSYTSLV